MKLIQREGYPEEGDLVWCTVTKIQFHSVFCNLEEYDKSGMIHISEVSPGRIRNIHDYVKEGKLVVCKILKISKDKGHIDLSLRRVSDGQRRKKANEIKQENKAEKVLASAAKKLNLTVEELYAKIKKPVLDNYDHFFQAFEEVVDAELKLTSIGIDSLIAKELESTIREKIKPKEVEISGLIHMKSYSSNGIELIKELLKKMNFQKNISITYAGGGGYKLSIVEKDYKLAENLLKEILVVPTVQKEVEFKFDRDQK